MNQELSMNANQLVAFFQKPTSEFTKADIVSFIREKDIRMVNFMYPAGDGRLKTLNFVINNQAYLEAILTCGERVDGSSLFSFIEAGSSDLYVIPRFCTAFVDPFAEIPTLSMLCSFFNKDFENLDVLEVEKKEKVKSEQKDDWRGFIKLCCVVFSRSILSNGISTFLAFYFIQQFSKSNSFASMLLSVFYGIGSITLLGGGIADCFGHRKMVRLSFCIFLPAIFIFTNTSHFVIALIMLIFMTCGESLSYSPMVVLG